MPGNCCRRNLMSLMLTSYVLQLQLQLPGSQSSHAQRHRAAFLRPATRSATERHSCCLMLSPAKRRDIVLNLSVCSSVHHALFLFCALVDSETSQPTTMKPIPYESWGSGLCHRGVRFSCPPKFRRDRPLKTAENHIFQFLELHNSKSF